MRHPPAVTTDDDPPRAAHGHPALAVAGDDDRGGRRRAPHQRADPRVRRRRSGAGISAHRQRRVRQRRRPVGHAGQRDPAHPHRPGVRACLPDAPLEHRGRGPVPAGRLGRERDRAGADPPRRNAGDRADPGDDGRRGRRRRCLGVHPGRPEGPARRQRDHRLADAQLRRLVLGPVLGVRPVVRRRLPADRAVPARSVAAAPDRPRDGRFRRSAA